MATRLARKTASTLRGLALTQVGRAPSLTLEAPTTGSPLEKLCFGALLSSTLRLPQGWEGAKLGAETSRHFLARGRVSPGNCGMEGGKCPSGTSPG